MAARSRSIPTAPATCMAPRMARAGMKNGRRCRRNATSNRRNSTPSSCWRYGAANAKTAMGKWRCCRPWPSRCAGWASHGTRRSPRHGNTGMAVIDRFNRSKRPHLCAFSSNQAAYTGLQRMILPRKSRWAFWSMDAGKTSGTKAARMALSSAKTHSVDTGSAQAAQRVSRPKPGVTTCTFRWPAPGPIAP
ncbi:hypothetical protein D3C81_1651840 [compost metagenome]